MHCMSGLAVLTVLACKPDCSAGEHTRNADSAGLQSRQCRKTRSADSAGLLCQLVLPAALACGSQALQCCAESAGMHAVLMVHACRTDWLACHLVGLTTPDLLACSPGSTGLQAALRPSAVGAGALLVQDWLM